MITLKQNTPVSLNVDMTGDPCLMFGIEIRYDDVIDRTCAYLIPKRGWVIAEVGRGFESITKRLPSELVKEVGPYLIIQFWQLFGAKVADNALSGSRKMLKEAI